MTKLEQTVYALLMLFCIITFFFGAWMEYLKFLALYKYVFG